MIGNAVKVMRIATGEEIDELPTDDGKDPDIDYAMLVKIYGASSDSTKGRYSPGECTIGKIDDLLVTRDGKEPYAVLSVGGFLGMGARMVFVRYDSLRFDPDNKIVLPGGTKDGLTMLPAFEYAKQ